MLRPSCGLTSLIRTSFFVLFSFFFSSRRRHTRFSRDWSSDVCSSDLPLSLAPQSQALDQRPVSFDVLVPQVVEESPALPDHLQEPPPGVVVLGVGLEVLDRKSTRLNSSHVKISYAVFCLKKKTKICIN